MFACVTDKMVQQGEGTLTKLLVTVVIDHDIQALVLFS